MSVILSVFKQGKFYKVGSEKVLSDCFVCDCDVYNHDYLKRKYKVNVSDSAKLLYSLLKLEGLSVLDEIDGIYSLAYFDGSYVFLARDLVGLKPLFYSLKNNLKVSSIKPDSSFEELNPKKVLKYDVSTGKAAFINRNFFSTTSSLKDSEDVIVKKLSSLFVGSVEKRIPSKKFGVMFSGGVDSTLIALVCKHLGRDFTCYTSHFSYHGVKESEDFVYAKKVASHFGFKLKIIEVNLDETESAVKKLAPFLGADAVKVGVALPEFFACQRAKEDGCGFVFSGLGSEELFAGYLRHKVSKDINKECLSGLSVMHDRDTYRDYVVSYLTKVNMLTPFLDNNLITYSLGVPSALKLNDGVEKYVIRQVAISLGIPKEFALRKKKAAQYGSNSDKALGKLARKHGFKYKADYLKSLT